MPKKDEAKNELLVQETSVAEFENYDLNSLGFDMEELDDLSGLEAINASDIRVPYGKIYAKPTDDREAGDIELPDGTVLKGKSGDVLKDLSILKVQSVRVYFPQPFKPSNNFVCRSLDGIKGAVDGEYAGRTCADCEFSKFPEEGGSSPCREQVLLLCTLPDTPLFYLLVSGIGVSEFKRSFLSVEMMKGLSIVKQKLKKKVLAALNITVSIEMQKTDFGPFPKPIFRIDREQPLVTMPRLKANLESYQSYKEFEQEAVATAATFAQHEQGEHEAESTGHNSDMF